MTAWSRVRRPNRYEQSCIEIVRRCRAIQIYTYLLVTHSVYLLSVVVCCVLCIAVQHERESRYVRYRRDGYDVTLNGDAKLINSEPLDSCTLVTVRLFIKSVSCVDCRTYRVGQIKLSQLTFLLATFGT